MQKTDRLIEDVTGVAASRRQALARLASAWACSQTRPGSPEASPWQPSFIGLGATPAPCYDAGCSVRSKAFAVSSGS
jgi:hypothetical protein